VRVLSDGQAADAGQRRGRLQLGAASGGTYFWVDPKEKLIAIWDDAGQPGASALVLPGASIATLFYGADDAVNRGEAGFTRRFFYFFGLKGLGGGASCIDPVARPSSAHIGSRDSSRQGARPGPTPRAPMTPQAAHRPPVEPELGKASAPIAPVAVQHELLSAGADVFHQLCSTWPVRNPVSRRAILETGRGRARVDGACGIGGGGRRPGGDAFVFFENLLGRFIYGIRLKRRSHALL